MSSCPQTERFDGLPQGAAELGQLVVHTLRPHGRHCLANLDQTECFLLGRSSETKQGKTTIS